MQLQVACARLTKDSWGSVVAIDDTSLECTFRCAGWQFVMGASEDRCTGFPNASSRCSLMSEMMMPVAAIQVGE